MLTLVKAAFDPRVLSSVCFFATDVHSATLGKGKNDNSLARVLKGDMTGKGELVVCLIAIEKGSDTMLKFFIDDLRETGT